MSFEGVTQLIAEEMAAVLAAEKCTIRVPNGQMLQLKAAYGTHEEARQKEIPIEGTIAGDAFSTGIVINILDITKDPRYDNSYIEPNGPRSLLAIPLMINEVRYGVAQIYYAGNFSKQQSRLANILAHSAALTLYHIETTKMSRRAILDIFAAILQCKSSDEVFKCTAKKISERLEAPSCLYKIFYKGNEHWCKIVAGEPENDHKIGLEDLLTDHPDIEATVDMRRIITKADLGSKTAHLKDLWNKKGINNDLYVPIIIKDNVAGIMVIDATKEKLDFSAEEKSFCFDAAQIVALFMAHERDAINEIFHELQNPNTSMGGHAERLAEPLTRIFEIVEEKCRHNGSHCETGDQIYQIVTEILPRLERVRAEAKRFDQSRSKLTETRS